MTDDFKIYVDAARPATLNDGAGKLTDYATLQEAVLAWQALPSEQKIRATVKMIGGPVYTAHQIDRLHYGRSRTRLNDDRHDGTFHKGELIAPHRDACLQTFPQATNFDARLAQSGHAQNRAPSHCNSDPALSSSNGDFVS